MLFKDAFQQLGNSQVEAKFAEHATYVYKGKEVDQQVHLGFDLAVTANVPVVAAERGVIVHASDLGIYGNCVVIDHGMGVQSLYGHLSSIGVKVGDTSREGRRDRAQRDDRTGRRRPPAFHDARGRPAGDAGGLVERAVDAGPGAAEDHGRRGRVIIGLWAHGSWSTSSRSAGSRPCDIGSRHMTSSLACACAGRARCGRLPAADE